MSQYILLNRIKVQNANAIAGFTWGFPAITHFLGFTHHLARKLADTESYNNITLLGCAVIAHKQQVHTYSAYGEHEFTQSKNPAYQHKENSKNKVNTPPVIEEGKMNMTVSLLIEYEGEIGGNYVEHFNQWLMKNSLMQRLAGGTILNIANIELHLDDTDGLTKIKRRLLPGFVLRDRSQHLEVYYQKLLQKDENTELLDAWLDFCMIKQTARPKSDLISKHLQKLCKQQPESVQFTELLVSWQQHKEPPFQQDLIPEVLKQYFNAQKEEQENKKMLQQWREYCNPTETTDADWEYIPKPESGYLVPIMTGYKAISEVYPNKEIANTRDNETDVCFVESVHSIGEWQSIHRLKTAEELNNCLWQYHYEKNWYLCQQNQTKSNENEESSSHSSTQDPDDDF